MTTTEPIATAARATARNLIAQYGPGLEIDVEAALHAGGEQRPGQYLDPVRSPASSSQSPPSPGVSTTTSASTPPNPFLNS